MNVGTLFTKSARTYPERLAIVYGDYELTYRQANERINKLANVLLGLGIKKRGKCCYPLTQLPGIY